MGQKLSISLVLLTKLKKKKNTLDGFLSFFFLVFLGGFFGAGFFRPSLYPISYKYENLYFPGARAGVGVEPDFEKQLEPE